MEGGRCLTRAPGNATQTLVTLAAKVRRPARERERLDEWRRRAVQALDDVERALKALY